MLSTTKRTAVLLSTAGLIAGSAVLPTSASAALTECGPGDTSTTFNTFAVDPGREAVSSVTLTNESGMDVPVSLVAQATATTTASMKGQVSFDEILAPLQEKVSADASASVSWNAGDPLDLSDRPMQGQSTVTIYGFETVSFSGSHQTCQMDGRFGPSAGFSGTAPTGKYVDTTTKDAVPAGTP